MTRDAGAGIEGRIALVTGGARGIGAAVVEALARAGAVVAAVDIDEEGLREVAARDYGAELVRVEALSGAAVRDAAGALGSDQVAARGASDNGATIDSELGTAVAGTAISGGEVAGADAPTDVVAEEGDSVARNSGDASSQGIAAGAVGAGPDRSAGRVVPFVADVGDSAAVARVVADVEREVGPIGIGVSVAGVLRPGSVSETSDEDWAATFAVNSTGVFTVLREISRRMQARGSGALVTVGSNAAGVPRTGMAAYAASKAAATMLTRCLGLELAGSGIRCNIVSPGSTDTDMQRLLWTDESGESRVIAGNPEQFRVGIPLGRIADPADIADAVLFLASDRARHITMQNLYVDGGATLRA